MVEKAVTTENKVEGKLSSPEVLSSEKSPIETETRKKSKKIKKQILKGMASIKCTYNNTIVNISDLNGAVLGWASSGLLGFKGAKKAIDEVTRIRSTMSLARHLLMNSPYYSYPATSDCSR